MSSKKNESKSSEIRSIGIIGAHQKKLKEIKMEAFPKLRIPKWWDIQTVAIFEEVRSKCIYIKFVIVIKSRIDDVNLLLILENVCYSRVVNVKDNKKRICFMDSEKQSIIKSI